MVDDIAQLPPFPFWLSVVLAVGLALFGLFAVYRGLHRARTIENAPTARVRSAHQGYVELVGKAQVLEGEPIVAPLSGIQCCWYRFRVEERDQRRWRAVRHGESDGLFLLRDDTGDCLIDPEGAIITAQHAEAWFGNGEFGGSPGVHHRGLRPRGQVERLLHAGLELGGGVLGGSSRYRYWEQVILPGDPLYAVGHFKSYDDIDHRRNRQELTAELLREWKRNAATLRARFDRDRNGRVDAEEWEHARRVAAQEAAERYAEQMRGQQLHSLARPADGRLPYLISNLPEFGLVKRYRWSALGGLVLFFGAGAAAVMLFSTRF
ncbi:MAG: GIDE domain-containing protein [Gammaproteobacteria bacterium]